MKKIVLSMLFSIATLAIIPDMQAGKAGAAIGGFLGGTIFGSALASRPCYSETVVVQEPVPVAVASSGGNRFRREIQELREDNTYLRNENRNLNREIKQLQQEVDNLQTENSLLQKDNKQLQKENLGLEKELLAVKKELNKSKDKQTAESETVKI